MIEWSNSILLEMAPECIYGFQKCSSRRACTYNLRSRALPITIVGLYRVGPRPTMPYNEYNPGYAIDLPDHAWDKHVLTEQTHDILLKRNQHQRRLIQTRLQF